MDHRVLYTGRANVHRIRITGNVAPRRYQRALWTSCEHARGVSTRFEGVAFQMGTLAASLVHRLTHFFFTFEKKICLMGTHQLRSQLVEFQRVTPVTRVVKHPEA